MEFLRFGSSIPGEYWGCCAGDIIQNFKQDPDTKASIQLANGDGGEGMTKGKELAFLGPTLRDIFWQRLRISTFGLSDMPNHFFIAILEDSQLTSTHGSKWLKLLKEAGFEYLRCVDNSVYTGPALFGETPSDDDEYDCDEDDEGGSAHKNHIFFLARNIGGGRIDDPFTPPKEWTDLPTPEGMVEPWGVMLEQTRKSIAAQQRDAHTEIWNKTGPTKVLKESEIVKAKAPVIMAGRRSEFPPQLKAKREAALAERKEKGVPVQSVQGTQYLY